MSRQRLNRASRFVAAPVGFLILVGAAGSSCSKSPAPAATTAAPPPPSPSAGRGPGPVEVLVTPDARARAGVETGMPERRAMVNHLKLPGTVAPDAYGQVMVLALVAGRVTAVSTELGAAVDAGQAVATILSSEFADAQAGYLSHKAALDADHERVMRLERLVTIGAASRQELDDARAMHANHTSELGRASARLQLYGFSAADIDRLATSGDISAVYTVRAPAAGIVTRRDVNPGQIVNADAAIVQVSRLDRVWILASAYEQDLGRLRTGLPATVSQRGRSEGPITSRIAYVDPQVNPATRTGEVRLELANASRRLKFGELVDVDIQLPDGAGALVVPSDAVQSVGSLTVVYVQDPQHAEVLRETPVTVGATDDGFAEIRSGLAPTDRVVTKGAVFVRAERLRTTPLGSGR